MPDSTNIAYCGLYCGDCIIRKQQIAARSEELRTVLQTPEVRRLSKGLPKIAPVSLKAFSKIPECCAVLKTLSYLKCVRSCRHDGGSPACKIRKCCRKKKLYGCWECGSFQTCKLLAWLKPVHGNAHIRNLKKIRGHGIARFLAGKKYW